MKTKLLSLALLISPLAAKEPVVFNELKLEDGTVLKAATVLRVEPDALHISHHEGVTRVKFENLPAQVQQQFDFDREEAEKFRIEREAAREAREAAERKARVEGILSKKRSEQDEDLRRGREEFFAIIQSGEYSYPQLEQILLHSIAALKEAARDDLAAILEDDRKLLREREVSRPPESLRKERDELAARVRDLENQIAQLNNKPADPPRTTTIWPVFVDRPVFIPQPVIVERPGSTPHCPPGTAVPRLTPYSPAAPAVYPHSPAHPSTPRYIPQTPAAPAAPRFIPQAPAAPRLAPSTPSAATAGSNIQGAHLWKK